MHTEPNCRVFPISDVQRSSCSVADNLIVCLIQSRILACVLYIDLRAIIIQIHVICTVMYKVIHTYQLSIYARFMYS